MYESLGEETLKELSDIFGKEKVMFVRCDVTQEDQVRHLWEEAESKLGYISLLVNNAGVNASSDKMKCLDIMLNGVAIGTVLAMEKMSKSKVTDEVNETAKTFAKKVKGGNGGRIVNIASSVGLLSHKFPIGKVMGYTAAKWGVVGLTRNFAWAEPNIWKTQGIKCFAICPSFVNTNLLTSHVNIKEVESKESMRALEPLELGQALMDALKLDSNGACLAAFPDAPLVDLPNFNLGMIVTLSILGKMLRLLGCRVATLDPYVLIAGSMLVIFVFFYFLFFLFGVLC